MSGPDSARLRARVDAWVRHAAEDERIARGCLTFDPPSYSGAAFHCQQAVEKLLKGFLVQAGIDFRKTHDLDTLAHSVAAHFPLIMPLLAPLPHWTSWGVAYRYPGESGHEPKPSLGELSEALHLIARLKQELTSIELP
jgi:HEPN domain-containing protein